jgi:outer membrane protein assembly factor BamB
MEEHEGFGFDEFSVEMEDFEYKQVKKFDRIFNYGEGGSFAQKPCIYKGRVYVGCLDKNVYCLDAGMGELIWKFRADGGFCPASPIAHDGMIYIGSYDFNFYALEADTGKLVWKYKTQGKVAGCATVDGDRIYFGSNDFNLYCLDRRTGGMLWKFKTFGEVPSRPTVHEGKVIFGSYDRFLYCVDGKTGLLLWKFETQGDIYHEDGVLVREGVVYFPSFDNYLRALDLSSRSLLWKYRTGNYGGMHSGPVVLDDMLIQVNREGVLNAITFQGRSVWKFRVNDAMALPMVHDGKVYIGTEDHNLYCLDSHGKVQWKYTTQGELWWKPAAWDGRICFTSMDCNLYCIDLNTREIVWKFRGQGAPSYSPPPFESYELTVKKPAQDSGFEEREGRKKYDIDSLEGEESGSQYKSRVTYQMSTQYQSKGGKYQVDSDEEAL